MFSRIVGTLVALIISSSATLGEPAGKEAFSYEKQSDRLRILLADQTVAEYIFRDPKILRPFFAQLKTLSGISVTRNYPPIAEADEVDHDTMHPGLWLGFGDLNGHDFWRNKAGVEHIRYVDMPKVANNQLTFATESRCVSSDGEAICQLINHFIMGNHPDGWWLTWTATFFSADRELVFGDQEEMGFGARVATPITEKHGGEIINSNGQKSATITWGQAAAWCDYSGWIESKKVGLTLIPLAKNFRGSWWHNRNYGLFVANPFGRAAMKQGERSAVKVPAGESFRLAFAAFIHDSKEYEPEKAACLFDGIE